MSVEAPILEPVALEYAAPFAGHSEHLLTVARRSFVLAAICGPCVAVCFSPAMIQGLPSTLLHLAVFALTIVLAIRCGLAVQKLHPAPPGNLTRIAEWSALLGLTVFAVVPLFTRGYNDDRLAIAMLMMAFGPLAATTARHVSFYRMLADHYRALGRRGGARHMLILGWFKAIYEGVWLGCCFIGLSCAYFKNISTPASLQLEDVGLFFAYGALFGVFGFGGVWLWMMIAHGLMWRAVHKART